MFCYRSPASQTAGITITVDFTRHHLAGQPFGNWFVENLCAKVTKGFSRSNLNYMRLVYTTYPICEEVPHKLSQLYLPNREELKALLEEQLHQPENE